MAKRAKSGTASGIRNKVQALTSPLPSGKEERKAEKMRRKQLGRGREMSSEELQRRKMHSTRIVSPSRPNGTRNRQNARAIEEQR